MMPHGIFARVSYVVTVAAVSVASIAVPYAQDQGPPGLSLNPTASVDKAKLKAFIEAPLFDPTRQLPAVAPPPPPPPAPVVIAAPDVPPSLRLLGIIQGKRDIAIVRRDDGSKTEMFYSGDHIGDWEVTVMPSAGIQLRKGDRVSSVSLFGTSPPIDPRSPRARAIATTPDL